MTARHSDTRDEILRIGTQLIKSHGYNAFSYADIADQLQIRNAAIHYHFRGKEDLLGAIIDGYISNYQQLSRQMELAQVKPAQRLEKFIERYTYLVDCNSICIIGSIASDYNTLPDSVRDKVRSLVELVLGLVEETLRSGKKAGDFQFTENAKSQALLVMTNLAAGVQLARITGKKDYEAIRRGILRQLKG